MTTIFCTNCKKEWNVKNDDAQMLIGAGAFHKPCHVRGIREGYILSKKEA